jgi:prepilin-type N-terminal cleavage/methylation domain-containing protein
MNAQRGFTLVEIAVALGILGFFLVAGMWAMAAHPAALAAATDDVDSALASARAIAASSGNGATVVVAPSTNGKGFVMRVYRGRPNAAGAVAPTNAMPVVAEASVREKTLGSPPFAFFVDSAGNASGIARYPSFDANGDPDFSQIAQEPACPAGGFALTITNLQKTASVTRTLPCRIVAAAAPVPLASPTPNVPIVTPKSLLFHWPADAQQSFVATEWGYTHWFASSTGFGCGDATAVYPNVLPSPYSAPQNPSEPLQPPQPPSDTPYSYPSSGSGMNDAPAAFLLQPQNGGLCTASIEDDYHQTASASVAVMGWLTAVYSGTSVTHASGALTIPASALSDQGSSVTIGLEKGYDTSPLQPLVTFTGNNATACTQDVMVTSAGGTTPNTPSSNPATASVTLTVNALPPAALSCTGVLWNHYSDKSAPPDAAAQAGEGIALNLSLIPPATPTPAPTPTPNACHSGTPCGVAIYWAFSFCTPIGGGKYVGGYDEETDYYQSSNGGATWTEAWNNKISGGDGSACSGDTHLNPYAAGPPPAGDPVNWSGVRDGVAGSPITWTPPNPPAYVTSEFEQ